MEDVHCQKEQVLSFNDESSPVKKQRTRTKTRGRGQEKSVCSPEFREFKGNKREVKEFTVTNSSHKRRGRPKKLDIHTDVRINVKETESQRQHSLKRKIHTTDPETLNEKKKLILSPQKLLSLKEIVNAAIVSKNMLNQSNACEPEQHEIETKNSRKLSVADKDLANTEKSEHVNSPRPNTIMISTGESSLEDKKVNSNISQECTNNATDISEEEDSKQQMHQPLSLVNACVQQLHRGVDERSYLLLMSRGLRIGNSQDDSDESKLVTSSVNTAVDDGSSLERDLDSSEQGSSAEHAGKTRSSHNDQSINRKCEGFKERNSNGMTHVIYQNKPKLTENRNLFHAIMSVENQMIPDNAETKNPVSSIDAGIPMDYSTSAHSNSQFSDSSSQFSQGKTQFSGGVDSARSYLFKDRDEESLLAAELLTRLPHGRIVDNDSHNSVIKLSDIQPTIMMDGNNPTHYFDQNLAWRGPHTNSASNSGPSQCCYGNVVSQDSANISLITGGRIHDNIVSDFSVPNSHLQTVSNIPSACSAFSPLQHSSPANSITASDILYQTNGFNPSTTQGQWNQNEGRRHSFPGVELPLGDSDTLHNRRSDPSLGHIQNWNSMTLENTANTEQTVFSHLTNPRQHQLIQCRGQQVMAPQSYNYDQILPENSLYDARQTDNSSGYMNQNSELHGNANFFERKDSSRSFRNGHLPNYNSNVDDHNNLVELQEGVQMLESISANIADCDMMNTGSTNLKNTDPGNIITVQDHSLHAELDNFSKSVGRQMQYFQPLNLKDNFDTQSSIQKHRRCSKTSKTRGSFQNEPEYLDFFNEVVYKENQGSYESTLQSMQSKDIDKEKFCLVLAPMVNPAEVNDIGHNGLIARYIDYLIVENEQITEMSKAVSIPIEHCVMDDPYLMDIIRVKVPFPTTKYYKWLRTFYPNIPIDRKAINRQILHFQPMGDCRQQHYMIDKRPTPVLLGESFYFFQRERDRLLPC